MRVVIAGCGRVGSQLATHLAHENHNVVIIDRDPESFRRLELPFNGLAIAGVAFDLEVLREAGIEEADAFVALTNYDNTNLMAAEIAKSIYGVPRVIARVYNPDKELTYRGMGIDYISGSALLAQTFHRELTWRGALKHVEKPGGCEVLEIEVPPASRGCRLSEIRQAGKSRLMALTREEKPLYLDRDTAILPGDRLLLAVNVKEFSWEDFAGALGIPLAGGPPQDVLGLGGASREERSGWRIVLAGCGRVGSQLAEMLSLDGYRVAVIDRDPRAGERLSKTFHGEFHTGMAFDLEVLEEAGIKEADAFAALTNYDNTNLMAAEVARGIYGVKRVISRLFNPDKEETYQALDIDFVCGTSLLAEQVMQRLLPHRPRILSRTANNRVLVVEFEYPERRRAVRAGKLEGEEMLRVGLVTRGGDTTVASPETVLRGGDTVVAAVLAPRLDRLRRLLAREGAPGSPRPLTLGAGTPT
ncbi:MAG: NAD-binding protein [Actinobacteria bacterium]|nr:NAD-binding protein [Actinomycetota bacterium]